MDIIETKIEHEKYMHTYTVSTVSYFKINLRLVELKTNDFQRENYQSNRVYL